MNPDQPGSGAEERSTAEGEAGSIAPEPARDTYGTGYGCACVSRDARNCILIRYGYCGHFGGAEQCECLCHEWEDSDE